MKFTEVHEDLKPHFRFQFFPPIHWPGVLWIVQKVLKMPKQKIVEGVALSTDTIGENDVRIYTPEGGGDGSALLLIHGGGLLGGEAYINDWGGSNYAKQLGITVISPGYRKAPANRAPAALDDCYAAWNWLLENAERLHLDPARIAIGGISAGGGLAACLAQRLFDQGGPQPVAQLFHYPMFDDRTAANRSLDADKHIMWNNQSNRVGWESYLGASNVGARTLPPYVSASRREDLSGLPPAWIGVGDVDLFYEENVDYARRLKDAGVECELVAVPGAPHGFDFFGKETELVIDYQQKFMDFLKARLRR